jgi:ATP-dependent DNA helicase RecG
VEYVCVLARHPNLSLEEIITLDKVQKKKELTEDEILKLKERKLIEGRKPNFITLENVAIRIQQVSTYLKTKGFDKEYYKKLVVEFIEKNERGSTKGEIRDLLWNKLSELLSDIQKITKSLIF